MFRPLAALALFALPAVASAQSVTLVPVGPPVIRGNVVSGPQIASGVNALFPIQSATPSRFTVGGGALGGYPQLWAASGPWGGVVYSWPEQPVVVLPAPEPQPATSAGVRVALADQQRAPVDQGRATLVLQFPAAAEVWVGGEKRAGEAATEWTLTSPALSPGAAHTFDVRGLWKAGGKTYEARRKVAVTAGDRSQAIVVAGTEVEK